MNHKAIGLDEFLRQYESRNTRLSYKNGIEQFLHLFYGDVDEDLNSLSLRYLSEDRDHRVDILSFKDSLKDKAPKTKSARLNAVRVFLEENEITFPKRFFKNLNGKSGEAITWEEIPNNQQIRRIIEYMPIQGKALALVLASSGMRIGESVQLKPEDLELEREPVRIKIRAEYTKTGKKRITFISPEAKNALLEWLNYRDQYIKTANSRSALRSNDEVLKAIFPFTPTNFNYIWINSLKKAKLYKVDSKTKRASMKPHGLRKFFRLRVGRYGRDEAEALMGHQKGLNAVYARFVGLDGDQRLEEIYKKSIPDLSIYGRSILVSKVDEELRENLRKSEDVINGLLKDKLQKDFEIKFLKEEIHKLQKRADNLDRKFDHFASTMDLEGEDLDKYIDETRPILLRILQERMNIDREGSQRETEKVYEEHLKNIEKKKEEKSS